MPFKQHIADLAHILKLHGIRHIVVCPGSRNAPLMQVFSRDNFFTCYSIVDERSAGYVALGMSKQLNEPAAIITTSGTAALNLAPAVAEAFFQRIPLIVITADRPIEWPPQFSNQVVKQEEIFLKNSKSFLNFPLEINDEDEMKVINMKVSETLLVARSFPQGPVHLNIPMKEPLYESITGTSTVEKLMLSNKPAGLVETGLIKLDYEKIKTHLESQHKVLIIAGVQSYTREELEVLEALSSQYQVTVLAENITNLVSDRFIANPEIILASLGETIQQLNPDFILTFGGQVVSKRVRLFVQAQKKIPIVVLSSLPLQFLIKHTLNPEKQIENSYLDEWKRIEAGALKRSKESLGNLPYSNLKAVEIILSEIKSGVAVHLGNSGTIRYSQLINSRGDLEYFSNRGTSGIDGSLSTAVGAAMVSEKLHIVILGDLSFTYDSNAMWNSEFPKNLRIIVLNDRGGGIFRIIDGPDRMPFFEKFSVTNHPVSIKHLANAFGLNYKYASDIEGIKNGIAGLMQEAPGLQILEADTSKSENSSIFKKFYISLQDQ